MHLTVCSTLQLHDPYSMSKLTDKGDTQMTSVMRETMEGTPKSKRNFDTEGEEGFYKIL